MPGRVTIGMLPKSVENVYFVAARKGAEEAAAELDARLVWDGPVREDPKRQAALARDWSNSGVDVIAASVADSESMSPALREARGRRSHVVTWDSDCATDARELHVAQATDEGIAHALAAEASRVLLGRGELAIITATLASPNQNVWIREIRTRLAQTSPNVQLVEVTPCNEDSAQAETEAQRLLAAHPKLGAIVALCTPALLPTAEAVRRSGRPGVKVIGTGAPQGCRPHIQGELIESIVGWSPTDLGYLVVHASHALARGTLTPGESALPAGRLGRVLVKGDEVRLGRPHVWSRANAEKIPD